MGVYDIEMGVGPLMEYIILGALDGSKRLEAQEIMSYVLYSMFHGDHIQAEDWFKTHNRADYENVRLMRSLSRHAN
jgi:hypothetical protein